MALSFKSNRGGGGKSKREKRERGDEKEVGEGRGDMRAIIIISKSIQIKVVRMYLCTVKSGLTRYYVLAPSFPLRKNTGTDTRHKF